jgi:hypothetical protein
LNKDGYRLKQAHLPLILAAWDYRLTWYAARFPPFHSEQSRVRVKTTAAVKCSVGQISEIGKIRNCYIKGDMAH